MIERKIGPAQGRSFGHRREEALVKIPNLQPPSLLRDFAGIAAPSHANGIPDPTESYFRGRFQKT